MDSREQLIALRTKTGMNKKKFAEYFGIPYRTLQDWELGNRRMPEYLLRLMIYKVEMEQLGMAPQDEAAPKTTRRTRKSAPAPEPAKEEQAASEE